MDQRGGRSLAALVATLIAATTLLASVQAAELPAAPPAIAPQVSLGCGASTNAPPRRSPLHAGAFDVHLSVGGGAGQPLRFGVAFALVQPLKRDDAGDANASGLLRRGARSALGRVAAARDCKS